MAQYRIYLKGEGSNEVVVYVDADDREHAEEHEDHAAFRKFGFRVAQVDKVATQQHLDKTDPLQ